VTGVDHEANTTAGLKVNFDAFANGQIESKLWLRDIFLPVLEGESFSRPPSIWILGGWYAMTAFLLLSAAEERIGQVRSFDIDESATKVANLINNHCEIRTRRFFAVTADCNQLDYAKTETCEPPQVVINTACEHFHSRRWWDQIPADTLIVLQSTDMRHPGEDVDSTTSLNEFTKKFPLKTTAFCGQRQFVYPTWSFNRYMLIGRK
jgi:hypothetical protein